MTRLFSYDITEERYDRVKEYVKRNKAFPSMGFFINYATDYLMEHRKAKFLSDFLYYLGFPAVAFIGLVGLTLIFADVFFYFLVLIVGVYLVILFYLFYNKYRGKQWK